MRVTDLIETAASNQPLSLAAVELVARELGMGVPELIDLFARTAATGYLRGDYSFANADMAMNQLFGFAHVETGLGLSAFAWQVFEAFDQGEYIREGVSSDEQGEALTRRLLLVIDMPDEIVFCCPDMKRNVEHRCERHADPSDCPDALVGRFGEEFGIRVHDGGTSFVTIRFCPWCGKSLITPRERALR